MGVELYHDSILPNIAVLSTLGFMYAYRAGNVTTLPRESDHVFRPKLGSLFPSLSRCRKAKQLSLLVEKLYSFYDKNLALGKRVGNNFSEAYFVK